MNSFRKSPDLKNVCGVRYKYLTMWACGSTFFINITIYSFVFTSPGLILKMYNPHRPGLKDWYSAIEYNRTQLVALAVWNSIMLVINTFLLFGIIFEIPCFLFLWIVTNSVAWMIHNVLMIIVTTREPDNKAIFKKIYLIFFETYWLLMIWYVINFWREVSDAIVDEFDVPWRSTARTRFITSMKRRTKIKEYRNHTSEVIASRSSLSIRQSPMSQMVLSRPKLTSPSTMFIKSNIDMAPIPATYKSRTRFF